MTPRQRIAVEKMIEAIGTLPLSRMEYIASVLEQCQKEHNLDTPAPDELRALGRAHDELVSAFHSTPEELEAIVGELPALRRTS